MTSPDRADDALDRPPTSTGQGYGYSPDASRTNVPRPGHPTPPWSGPSRAVQRRWPPVRPSAVFGLLVAVLAGSGAYLWTTNNVYSSAMRVGVFVFVAVGWVISLCVHEFAHATTAWVGGDRSVEAKGYLTLDPRRYMNRQLSIVLPIIIVLIGGIGLPGGAVMIDRRLIPKRGMRSLVSASGPLTNLVFAIACAVPLQLHLLRGHGALTSALAFLAFLEVAATVLNALPVPGLDGFGVIAPWLPDETVASLMPISQYVFFGLFIVLFYSSQASGAFLRFCFRLLTAIGVSGDLADQGHRLFTFWKPF